MLQIRRVVHATDFSDSARTAFAHALHLARQHAATLEVVHVAPQLGELTPGPEIGRAFYPRRYQAKYRTDQEALLRTYVAGADTSGVEVNVVPPFFGVSVAETLVAYAREVQADLIVMGAHSRHGLKRFVAGRVAQMVIRQAPCPVLTFHPRPAGGLGVQRVLAAVELTFFAEELVAYAAALAPLYGATLDLLHVIDGVSDPLVREPGFARRPDGPALLEARARERLQALRQRVTDPALPVACHVAFGPTLTEVPAAIARLGPDLVVLGGHGRKGLERLLLGSVAAHLVRDAPCATFIVKPSGRSLLPRPLGAGAPPEAVA